MLAWGTWEQEENKQQRREHVLALTCSYLVVTEDFCSSNNLKSQAARAIFFAQFQILVSNDIALKNAELESVTCQYEKK